MQRPFALAPVAILALFVSFPVDAQPPPTGEEDPPAYDPYPGAAQDEDPGSSLDPTFLDYKATLGEEPEPYDGDPSLLDYPDLYPPELVGTGPSVGLFTSEDAKAQIPDCKIFPRTGRSVTPVGVSGANPRYFSYRGLSSVFVGWSADAACHFKFNNPDNCNAGIDANPPQPAVPANYPALLAALRGSVAPAQPKLRKLRLWVSLAGESRPDNVPFLAVGNPAAGGYWRLDMSNQGYFDRLRAVVNQARKLDLFVEITFFAPFQAKQTFNSGPWSFTGNKAKAPKADGTLEQVGFSQVQYLAILDHRTNNVDAARNERMRDFQRNVILWTINELWCFENVWYEIANEPEDQTVDPVAVAEWQKAMIDQVATVEGGYVKDAGHLTRSLQRRHLIAVQPWTATGANLAFLDSRISIVNTHYTTVTTDPIVTLPFQNQRALDLGAITLARTYAPKARILGFNETKITPLGGASGDRSHLNGVLQTSSRTDSARAEAWEFLLTKGGAYDHWSYNSKAGATSPTTGLIRTQLQNIQSYFDGLPLDNLSVTTPDPPNSWVTDISRYPGTDSPLWEAGTSSRRYWAGLQTPDRASGRMFVLYNHHSTPRCHKINASNTEVDYQSNGCPDATTNNRLFLSFGGYDARSWTQVDKRYKDSFSVNLGTSQGKFTASWKDPASLAILKAQKVFWKRAADAPCTLPTCIVCNSSSPCLLESPPYDFDVVLEVAQQP